MAGNGRATDRDIREIKQKIAEMQADLKRFLERSNRDHVDLVVAGARKDLSNAIVGYVADDMEEGLDHCMVKRCEMLADCRAKFSDFLAGNTQMLGAESVSWEDVARSRSALEELRKCGPFKKCEICFSGVKELLEKEVSLMGSMQLYRAGPAMGGLISDLPVDEVVDGILDPVANRVRLEMLKSLYSGTRTFSDLSGLTGLRGGNLLFHLQKLADGGMVIQRHAGGDYMITEKGYKVLKSLSDVQAGLGTR